jgi:hypothetical protein
MRYVKGDFVLTGPDVLTMRFKKAEDERKLASALIVFSAFRVSNPPTRPGETAHFCPSGGHDLPKALPQLKRRERVAHIGNRL